MSFAVVVKVYDGLALAADSALSIVRKNPDGSAGILRVYNNANKIVHLHKAHPIGCITHGIGSIGYKSIPAVLKDFRTEIQRSDGGGDESQFSVGEIARRLADFLVLEAQRASSDVSGLEMLVVGYSAGKDLPEILRLHQAQGGSLAFGPEADDESCMVTCGGVAEAVSRLLLGFSPTVEKVITQVVKDGNQSARLMSLIKQRCTRNLAFPPMPIQDAIDLARFLAELTINFHRFSEGAPIVGGPVEVASITKHEGFKWISRKHYYEEGLNRHAGLHR